MKKTFHEDKLTERQGHTERQSSWNQLELANQAQLAKLELSLAQLSPSLFSLNIPQKL